MIKLTSKIAQGFFFALLVIVFVPAIASAATISVDGSTRDFNPGETLQEALVGVPAGSSIVVNISPGETLAGMSGSSRHYETFPSNLASITFTGGGNFSPTLTSGSDNLYAYFHGVPVILDNITFIGTVYGGTPSGGNSQGVLSSTNIIMNNAVVTTGLVGGSVNSDVGIVSIAISGDQSRVGSGNVTGGNRRDEVHPTTGGTVSTVSIAITGGSFGYIYGGGQANTQTIQTSIAMTGGTAEYVFGGSPPSEGFVGSANVSLSGNAQVNVNVFGGGEGNSITGESHIALSGGSVGNSVYVGGHSSAVSSGTITMTGGTVASRVLAGGFGGSVEEGVISISGGSVGRVYGGGHNGGTVESAQISIVGGPYRIADVSTGGTTSGLAQNSRIVISGEITGVNSLAVEPEHTLLFEEGSQLTTLDTATINNAGTMVTHGPIESNNSLINNGVIVVSSDGVLVVNGTHEGTGSILFRQITANTNGQVFILDTSSDLVLNEASGTPDQIDYIEIDGLIIDVTNFTASSTTEGTEITINREYLNTLEPGEHTIQIVFFDTSHTEGVFTVAPAAINPEPEPEPGKEPGSGSETPGASNMPRGETPAERVGGKLAVTRDNEPLLGIATLLVSSVALFLSVLYTRKKKSKNHSK